MFNLEIDHGADVANEFVTISLVVAAEVPTSNLVALADKAFYKVKSAGRNRVEVSEEN